jgi:LmbE family N-acetylglucosaminyl deacetylase
MARFAALGAALLLVASHLPAQPTPRIGAAELEQTLDRLNTLGSVLMMAAHPDDENTAVLSYFARGRHMRTAYLSATRGEGGQNLIGSEQGALLGLIRTQELLAARRIDGAEQFFSRSIDFGYSKFPEEALEQWGRDRLLADMVRVIRQFQPDVILARFPPPPGDGGHGQHTAVGHLGPAAFEAAADPNQFAELGPAWQAKRYYWNVFNFGRPRGAPLEEKPGRLTLEIGDYDPVLGKSYAEISGESRSMHRSQAMGASQYKGALPAQFDYFAGDQAAKELFDGIDTTWSRVIGGEQIGKLLAKARDQYEPTHPEKILPDLLSAWRLLSTMSGHWPDVKRQELLRAIELASGLWLDATAEHWDATPGAKVPVELTVINRAKGLDVVWIGVAVSVAGGNGAVARTSSAPAYNQPVTQTHEVEISSRAPYSQPPWLVETSGAASYDYEDQTLIGLPEAPPRMTAKFSLQIAGVPIAFTKPVIYRWVDDARGERERDVQVVPLVAVSFNRSNLVFPTPEPRTVAVRLTNNLDQVEGKLLLLAPQGWSVSPTPQPVKLERKGQETTVEFQVTPPAGASSGKLQAQFDVSDGRTSTTGMQAIEYDHIPIQMVYPEAELRVERIDLELLSRKIGYIMGAGDLVPEALRELGAEVTLLSPADLSGGDLSKYDAIVAGVRSINTRPDLLAARERLFAYVEEGGTLVMQYNTFERRGPSVGFGPYPVEEQQMTRDRIDRIVDENAPVRLVEPDHPLLQAPNPISEADFEGWIQERGLYFMGKWDERYSAPTESSDERQPAQRGGLLYTKYGRGVYIFTGYSFFRQLPAGVPGAYRLFANLVSAGKIQ